MTITDKELNEIEARANAATPGPWINGYARFDPDHPEYLNDGAPFVGWVERPEPAYVRQVIELPLGITYKEAKQALQESCVFRFSRHAKELPKMEDVAFIVHARTDIPRLIAEVRDLHKQLADSH